MPDDIVEVVSSPAEVVSRRTWQVEIDISQLPVTTPEQTKRIQTEIAALALDRKAVFEWRGDAGRFTIKLLVASEKSRDAWMIVDRTLTDVCVEETGAAPRIDNYAISDRT